MSDSRAAGGMDRLPWLSDEPVPVTAPAGRGCGRDRLGRGRNPARRWLLILAW